MVYNCNFCNKSSEEVEYMLRGPEYSCKSIDLKLISQICSECIEAGKEAIAKKRIENGWRMK